MPLTPNLLVKALCVQNNYLGSCAVFLLYLPLFRKGMTDWLVFCDSVIGSI